MKTSNIGHSSQSDVKPNADHPLPSDAASDSPKEPWQQCKPCIKPQSSHADLGKDQSADLPGADISHYLALIAMLDPFKIQADPNGSNSHGGNQETPGDATLNVADITDGIASAIDELAPGMTALVDELMKNYAQHQLFEVIMPDNQTIGVLVQAEAQRVNITLTPYDRHYAKTVKKYDKALEKRLKKRLGKDVDLAVVL